MDELLKMIEQLLQLEDSVFNASRELIEKRILESFSGSEGEKTIHATANAFRQAGYSRMETVQALETLKENYANLLDSLKEKTENEEKKKFLDNLKASSVAYFNAVLPVYEAEHPLISIQLLREGAKVPTYAHRGDQGCDLYLPEDITIEPNARGVIIPLGIAVAIPVGWALAIRPRSGLSHKSTLRISNTPGTIDTSFKDEVGVIVDNLSDSPLSLKAGDRIAQFILEKNYQADFEIVENVKTIGEDRGGGYGSTGN